MGIVFGEMAASLDGYIASKSGDLAWLNDAMRQGEDYGFMENMKRTGVYIMGAKTYELSKEMFGGGGTTKTYVVTHQKPTGKEGKAIEFYNGDLTKLVEKAKAETDKDICIFGGGDIFTQILNLDLMDELGIAIIPVMLGEGTAFSGKLNDRKKLTLHECKNFGSGIVMLKYMLNKNKK